MARIARAVAPGISHHVTQRGNRRQQAFFGDEDYQAYLELMAEWCAAYNVQIWAYCLMPNHVHMIAVPETKDGLNFAIGEAHRRYTRRINITISPLQPLVTVRLSDIIQGVLYILHHRRTPEAESSRRIKNSSIQITI